MSDKCEAHPRERYYTLSWTSAKRLKDVSLTLNLRILNSEHWLCKEDEANGRKMLHNIRETNFEKQGIDEILES